MRKIIFFLSLLFTIAASSQTVSQSEMQLIYNKVKTPYKYGMVVAPTDNHHKIDCPSVYHEGDMWYMNYVVYNGKVGTDGRGYETWLAESPDLMHWKTLGRVLSYRDGYWDCNQRGGFPSLIDWTWDGTYAMKKYKGRHWMTYIGGEGTGYEGVRAPLFIGQAWTTDGITSAHEWQSMDHPLLSIHDKDAQWWEKLIQYKSTIYYDKDKTLGKPFVMFYNAGGINPQNNMKAERIGIALSNDMKSWKRYDGNPVFTHESQGIITGDAQIVKMDGLFVMFYFSAYNPSRHYNAYNTFAVSRDLVHWSDWTGADLIYPTKKYDEMFAHKSCVVEWKGVVYHFYCAVDNEGQRGIALASSVPLGSSDVSFPQPDRTGCRTVINLDDHWQTHLLSANDSLAMNAGTIYVTLPHNWDDYYGCRQLKHGNLHGTAIYEKTFSQHKSQGHRYFLQMEGVGTYATVNINGHAFEREPIGRTVCTLDVTDALADGSNSIKITVDHPEMITDMPWVCGGCSSEWGFSEGSQPFGIFRPVSLIETDEVRIEPFGVHIWNNSRADSIFIDTEVKNYGSETATVEVVNKFCLASGKQVFRLADNVTLQSGEMKTVHQCAHIDSPKLWSTDNPYLYRLTSMIKRDGGKTTDEVSTPFGVRTISWPLARNNGDNRFLLNGKPVFINGTCEYEHLLGQSHAFTNEEIASRVKMISHAGFNAYREAHQPHSLYYQTLFDKQGLLFWSQFSAHIWYDTPQFRANFKKMLCRWIRERRNSPSVVLWGLQNESILPKDFAAECTSMIKQLDPTAGTMRMVTTCNGGEGTDWNVVQNWSGTYGGNILDYGKELQSPSQLLNGEYGAWRTLGLHSESDTLLKDKSYSEERFSYILETKLREAERVKDSVCGHFQWLLVSHDNPGRVQPDEAIRRVDKVGPFNYKGLLSPWEQPTDAYFMYKSNYVSADTDPMVYIVSHTWADRFANGERRADINIYSNCDSVALYNDDADGQLLGVKKRGGIGTHFVWEQRMIRYNVLRAVGYRGGKAVAEDIILLDGLSRASHYDALYRGSAIVPTPADRNDKILKPQPRLNYIYRVNCGGDSYTDSYGNRWAQDSQTYSDSWSAKFGLNPYLASQSHISVPIHGTNDWPLFQYFRFGRHQLKYHFNVPAGRYRVELYFAEPWLGAGAGIHSDCEGQRIFSVDVNGRQVASNLDLWAKSGYAGAYKVTVDSVPSDGKITVSFPDVKAGEAVISAIAIASYQQDDSFHDATSDNGMDASFWRNLDADKVEKLPASLLPHDSMTYPASRYVQEKPYLWTIKPGLAREYALRFLYKNTTSAPVKVHLLIVDAKGTVMEDREMTFPVTPDKFKTISTTTGTQINAGNYSVMLKGGKGLTFDYLEIQ